MELFTLGIGNYSEADVAGGGPGLHGLEPVARRPSSSCCSARRHDNGVKTFLGHTGQPRRRPTWSDRHPPAGVGPLRRGQALEPPGLPGADHRPVVGAAGGADTPRTSTSRRCCGPSSCTPPSPAPPPGRAWSSSPSSGSSGLARAFGLDADLKPTGGADRGGGHGDPRSGQAVASAMLTAWPGAVQPAQRGRLAPERLLAQHRHLAGPPAGRGSLARARLDLSVADGRRPPASGRRRGRPPGDRRVGPDHAGRP